MNNATQALTTPAPAGLGQRLEQEWRSLARHGAQVILFCLMIAALFWLARPGRTYLDQLVYSLGTGISSWLVIDLGRFVVDPQSPWAFPRGWRGLCLVIGGVLFGFGVGTLAGDAYTGVSTWVLIADSPQRFAYFFAITVAIGTGVSYYFYAVGKSAGLLRELEASRRQASEAQLKLLQSQLEPHMLFNTLANLRALVTSDAALAQQMLDRLIAYLRATLSASRSTEHSLEAEFARLRDYLELMAIRLGPRLRYELDLPTTLLAQPVPTLLLQPLVENALRHGIEPKIGGGQVVVRARADGPMLALEVSDSGLGLPPHTALREGFGLSQVRERLLSAYGANASFALTNAPGGGTCVRLRLPLSGASAVENPKPEGS